MTTGADDLTNIPLQAFISYARDDDDEFEFVTPFVSRLKAMVRVKFGRDLNCFVDKQEIGWGEEWRERLRESVDAATLFIPFITATYLGRPHCRDEFLTFLSKAQARNVPDLILPILPFRTSIIAPGSSDEIVQFVESHQYKVIEEGLLAGRGSPEWNQTMAGIADDLWTAVSRAEAALTAELERLSESSQSLDLTRETGDGGGDAGTALDLHDEAPGFFDLMGEMNDSLHVMTKEAEAIGPAIQELGIVVHENPTPNGQSSPQKLQVWAISLARLLGEPSREIEQHGRGLFNAVKRFDQSLTEMQDLARLSGHDEMRRSVEEGISGLKSRFSEQDLREVESTMRQLLESMRPAEVMSVALRKALRPARNGLTRVDDSLRLLSAWEAD